MQVKKITALVLTGACTYPFDTGCNPGYRIILRQSGSAFERTCGECSGKDRAW